MAFFDQLLGANGCSVDGTVMHNPFTSVLDQSMQFMGEQEHIPLHHAADLQLAVSRQNEVSKPSHTVAD